MDCLYVTELRTPCVALVSAKHMARKNSKTFGMLGCGLQGRAHIKFVCNTLTNLEKIYIYDVYAPAMDALISDLQPSTPVTIVKARSYEELVKNSDVICSATKITSVPHPQIKDEWISKGQTIIMSDCHTLYEDETVKRADKYLLDSREQHELLLHYGYYPQGLPPVYAEIGEVVAGQKKGRERDDELIVCNNVGIMATDMMLIPVMFDRALENKIGRILPL
ncbi:Delta(1)-pyrroline-2-carboxylate reductase [bioreactor metagenome]|uniref:Delta(1)-pyrroline-2-carboxylate reductase n=1 Tax=bioreactor metagenome TaxID=1076179 RepID=A0A645FLV1_9ZZZZ